MTDEFYGKYASANGLTVEDAKDQVEEIVKEVSQKCSEKHRFGYLTAWDVYQEGYLECVRLLSTTDNYKFGLPLVNFLSRHLNRRLRNLKRATYYRYDRPCKCCDRQNPPENPCKAFLSWVDSNNRKLKTHSPASLEGEVYSREMPVGQSIEVEEILAKLPPDIRQILEMRMDGENDRAICAELGIKKAEYNWKLDRAGELYTAIENNTPPPAYTTVYYHGKVYTLVELATKYKLSYSCLYNRLNKLGWSIEKALKTPIRGVFKDVELNE